MKPGAARWCMLLLSVAASAALVWLALKRLRPSTPSVALTVDANGHDPLAPPAFTPDPLGLPGVLEVAHPRYPPSTFRRTPWDPADFPQATAARINPMRFDPLAGFTFSGGMDRRRPWSEHPDGGWVLRTNSYGLRNDDEPSATPPDLRVLVVGDSHTAGYCNNAEGFPHLTRSRLAQERPGQRVEVLNGAVPGYSFVHYLGKLESLLGLAPDVLVVGVYGGNDFLEALGFQHRAHGTARGDLGALEQRVAPAREVDIEAVSQFLFSVAQFHFDPPQAEVALQAARDVLTEIQVTCLRHGIGLVVVYLPPPPEVDWERHAQRYERVFASLGLARDDLRTLTALGDSTLDFLRSRGTPVVDLRPSLRASSAKLFWEEDFHLAPGGHALAAEALAPVVSQLAPRDSSRVRRASPALRGEEARALLSPGAGKPAAPPVTEAGEAKR